MRKWIGLLCLILMVFAFPVSAQDAGCGKSCGGCDSKSSCSNQDNSEMMAAMAKCEICKLITEQPELMAACDYSLADWSQGLIISVNVKKPELMKQLRAFEEREKKACKKFEKMSGKDMAKSLCPFCVEYFSFIKKGTKEERVQTPAGTITILTAKDPALIKELHAWSSKFRKSMGAPEPKKEMKEKAPVKKKKKSGG